MLNDMPRIRTMGVRIRTADGRVIGVVNSVFVKGTKEAALSAPSGITYAIPTSYVRELIRGL